MAVEILVLSGNRRNERIVLDCRAFQVGCDPNCEVFFDPQHNPAVEGRSAKFRLQEGGWYVRCAGGDMWIGTQRIAGAMHVRSGDVIRMSEVGPEFSFHIVAVAKASPTDFSGSESASSPIPGREAAVNTAQAESQIRSDFPKVASGLPEASGLNLATPDPLSTDHQIAAAGIPAAKATNRPWAVWVVGGLAVAILAVIAVRAVLLPPTVNITVNQPAVPTVPGVSTDASISEKPAQEGKKTPDPSGNDNRARSGGGDESKKPPAGQVRAATDLRAQLAEAVFLIVVEKADRYWPHATCVAVGNDTLLTTAYDAADLAKMRDKDSYKIWVTLPSDNQKPGAGHLRFNFKAEVQDLRVLAPYAVLSEESESTDRFFVNIGLLTVQGALPKIASLASPKELDEVEEGFPVVCFGFTHEGQKMTRFDKLEPRLTSAKVFGIEIAQKLPGQPKLLYVQAEIPKNAYGSPVVNSDGKILGLYSDAIPEKKSQGLKNLHYVTMVNPELIDLWLRDRDNAKIWVPASPAPTPSKVQKQP
jgi:hypothetical protein